MRIGAILGVLLGAAPAAWGQSLLGESGASPYDPPLRPVLRRHDFLKILVRRAEPAAGERPARRPARAAEARDEGSFSVPVEVADVRPNGTLVVQAIRRRRLGGQEEVVRLTGEVAASSVQDGTVPLEEVHNLSVVYKGPGRAEALGARGFLGSLLATAWPF